MVGLQVFGVSLRTRGFLIVAGTALALAVIAWAAHAPLLRWVAGNLSIEDALAEADAIVVVAGRAPFRERAAADLYAQGWAPRVVISRSTNPPGVEALVSLGVRPLDLQAESRAALVLFGVPASGVVALTEPVRSTEEELAVVQREAQARGWQRLILVSSAEHTRRVKTIWYRWGNGDVEAIVRGSPYDRPVGPWWRDRGLAEEVFHEYLGLAAIYLGISGWMR
jgi:uncharacterized SAM-binding protein YcdF (DUF218 family)